MKLVGQTDTYVVCQEFERNTVKGRVPLRLHKTVTAYLEYETRPETGKDDDIACFRLLLSVGDYVDQFEIRIYHNGQVAHTLTAQGGLK